MEFPRALDRSRDASVREVIKALGLDGGSPALARSSGNEGSIDPELGQDETTMFRAVAARLNNLSQDRPILRSPQ